MKQRFFLLAILFFAATSLFAQQATPLSGNIQKEIPENVQKEIKILEKAGLNLSDVQLTRITAVLISNDQLLQKNLQTLKDNPPLLDVRLKELKANKLSNIQGAMSDQQVEKFKAIHLEDKF